ncbi:MAG: serine hydroxymethyltransferase [Alphaproteobacteria bacterium]|nr:serine hydroxymethyltransferase [Alphaproteobacteria bacterium]
MLRGREILFEFVPVGGLVRVSAIDAATGVEVTLSAPAGGRQADLERIAAAKLAYRLRRDGLV